MSDKPRDHRSTFPISTNAIRQRKACLIALSPITWIPIVALFPFGYYLGFSSITTLLVGLMIASFWISKRHSLEETAIRELVQESNNQQDNQLLNQTKDLFENGFNYYGSTMASFTVLKRDIESALHTDGGLTEQKQEIERLVDTIVFGASDKIKQLVNLERRLSIHDPTLLAIKRRNAIRQAREEISDQLEEAFATLEATQKQIAVVLNPAHIIEPTPVKINLMETAIADLKKEQELADRIRDRLELDDC